MDIDIDSFCTLLVLIFMYSFGILTGFGLWSSGGVFYEPIKINISRLYCFEDNNSTHTLIKWCIND